jgi:enoyl-[acyl-carrier protein] reductase / trans-2-enoyl-CoA reductase (NAD+)
MIIEPKFRGFICTAAHPQGCHRNVSHQVDYVESQGVFDGPKNVLVIGASTGYGLASRIAATFGANAKTIGVFFEKPASGKRTASAGWYNTVAFEKIAHEKGHYAKSINGDAFSDAIKAQTAQLIEQDLGKVDLIIYSLASPRRTEPTSGTTYSSVLKPIGEVYTNKTVDPLTGEVKEISIEPAVDEEIDNTIRVMGGEDWSLWVDYLRQRDLLAEGVQTIAYSYIGPDLTHAVYKNGTIGRAKDHLYATAKELTKALEAIHGSATISVNKALVTQASAAIPVVPLYIAILFKLMKQQGTHEGCIEQIDRLLRDNVYTDHPNLDPEGRIRVDDLEMAPGIQKKIEEIWQTIDSDNIEALTDIQGYRDEFYRLFGFGLDDIDYKKEVDVDLKIRSID